ncbi:MBL fold metallo-hydrolase [Yersinia enterocolitica]|uniref:DNA internalization-related competence protein ComEC/Rec2 n=1 Tax=Yersinia enterocolitica TaxID=630 RepID=A0A9P1PUV2_YEREN|nr:MBL fold metallo-hydrolase [Yersinia enterocolitica]EKN3636079.1 MBL fold metallo-hydrolase [Yersinia enterocolitica]EME3601363.1 MBL fold metallo-hydrolase [Yersinia enterocolitica]CCQ40419.1 putative hydrolase [Yersinia enterocolitica (type O:5) str. YE53/03]CNF56949.1 DNA internalization-related competence protein ComEC/Rec2 [Yersinia enterocolitica]HDL7175484.1 MBL fold metallo-hydrolase [Yersinia enterocolitica]
MGYEVDILNIGDTKSGDAIIIRWGNLYGDRSEQKIVVIDGGYKNDGERVVNHIKDYFGTESIDLLVLTHPDNDHVGGLSTIINSMQVKEFWIHEPWKHNLGLAQKFSDGRITDSSVATRLEKSLQKAFDVVKLAESKNIPTKEPFTGLSFDNGKFVVLGPTQNYYETLIPDFKGMPAKAIDESLLEKASVGFEAFKDKIKELITVVADWFVDEKIDNNDTTSAQNNASVITQLSIDGKNLVFTGDAGITALTYAEPLIDKDKLIFIQIPHHGSKRNVGPEILNKILGEPTKEARTVPLTAIASSAKNGHPKHPHQAVLNAFLRRGAKVLRTTDYVISHRYDAPQREGWSTISGEQFKTEYQEEA